MASSVIHMAVASEINKKLKRNNDLILIGSIAPDISKQMYDSREKSHFIDGEEKDVPNIDRFLNIYKDKLNDDFVLGYFIHIYTDLLWFKYFIPEIYDRTYITKLDGTRVKCSSDLFTLCIYNDYTNMNSQLLKMYNLDTSSLKRNLDIPHIIKEIPMDKLYIIINKTIDIIEKSKITEDIAFNIENINIFINTSVELILAKLNELNIN